MNRKIAIQVDGRSVQTTEGVTLLEALRTIGVEVPTLCHHQSVSPYGACRLCLVEVKTGPRTMLAASCMYPVAEGIEVETASERVRRSRRMVAELLLARCPEVPAVRKIATGLGISEPRFRKKDETCALCGLCARGCQEIAEVGAIGFVGRGVYMEMSTPFADPSGACVGCTTCLYLCPTGSLSLDTVRRGPVSSPAGA